MSNDEPTEECLSCGECFDNADIEHCPKSKRKCGHHCNHIWSHDVCDWCGLDLSGVEFGQEFLR